MDLVQHHLCANTADAVCEGPGSLQELVCWQPDTLHVPCLDQMAQGAPETACTPVNFFRQKSLIVNFMSPFFCAHQKRLPKLAFTLLLNICPSFVCLHMIALQAYYAIRHVWPGLCFCTAGFHSTSSTSLHKCAVHKVAGDALHHYNLCNVC